MSTTTCPAPSAAARHRPASRVSSAARPNSSGRAGAGAGDRAAAPARPGSPATGRTPSSARSRSANSRAADDRGGPVAGPVQPRSAGPGGRPRPAAPAGRRVASSRTASRDPALALGAAAAAVPSCPQPSGRVLGSGGAGPSRRRRPAAARRPPARRPAGRRAASTHTPSAGQPDREPGALQRLRRRSPGLPDRPHRRAQAGPRARRPARPARAGRRRSAREWLPAVQRQPADQGPRPLAGRHRRPAGRRAQPASGPLQPQPEHDLSVGPGSAGVDGALTGADGACASVRCTTHRRRSAA